MSLIIAARFDTFDAAENAARALFHEGFTEDSVSIFFVNQAGAHARYPMGGDEASDAAARNAPGGAVMGAVLIGLVGLVFGCLAYFVFNASIFILIVAIGIGAYLGSLLGALLATRRDRPAEQPGAATGLRHAGVLTAVHVHADNEAVAARTLRDIGGKDVEQATGLWKDGNWLDFDPVHPPVLSDKLNGKISTANPT